MKFPNLEIFKKLKSLNEKKVKTKKSSKIVSISKCPKKKQKKKESN